MQNSDEIIMNRCCCWGLIDELKNINLQCFDKKILQNNIKYMEYKIIEIECWESEEQNQDEKTLHDFDIRRKGINECIAHMKNHLKLSKRSWYFISLKKCIVKDKEWKSVLLLDQFLKHIKLENTLNQKILI